MEYNVGRKISVPSVTTTPFAIATSSCNVIAAVTLQGIHLFEMVAAVNRKEPFQFDHRVIATAVEPDPAMNPDTDRSSLNRNIKFNEIHDVFLDRTLSPCRASDESVGTAFRLVSWSPTGLLSNKKSILAAATADHRVILYQNGIYSWEVIGHPSTCLINHLRQNDWAVEPSLSAVPESCHSTIFTVHKSRAYLLGTVALAWSPLYSSAPVDVTGGGRWAWLVTLQRSGHVVLWKVSSPNGQFQLAGSYDLQLADPSSIQLSLGSHPSSCFLVAGSHSGIVKCWAFSWIAENTEKSNVMPEFCFLSTIYPEMDGLAVGALRIYSIGRFRIVAMAKNSALVAISILLDGNGLRVVQTRYALLSGLQLSGWMDMVRNRILCISEDYQLNEVDLSVDDQGIFTVEDQLPITPISLPSSPTMLSRGIAGSPDANTLFILESIKVPYDHLKCREPTSLAVYLAGDIQRVIDDLKKAETMNQCLLTLESYKALYGQSWESIWELECDDPTTESIHNLQLLRWLALFKAHVCYLERRHDKDLHDDLKARAERAEVILQLRHVQKTFAGLLERQVPSSEEDDRLLLDEQLVVRLSCDLVLSLELSDRGLTDQVRRRFCIAQSSSAPVDELCPICSQVIPFEKREDGICPSGHKAIRCRATLRTCFDITRSCRWCGTHYHPESGVEECILCGGPAV